MAPLPKWLLESLVEYGIGAAVILLRVFARLKTVGVRGWKGDDYMILLAFATYTGCIYCLHGISVNGINTNVSTAMALTMTQAQRDKVKLGSKQNFGTWLTYTAFLWCLKSCMLFLYWRLHLALWQRRTIYFTAVLVALTYAGVLATILGHCHPIEKNWQVLPYAEGCVPNYYNFYVVGVTNFVTDAIVISIPLPILWRSRMPIRRKLLLSLLLCSGIFIMIAICLRNILSLIRLYQNHGKNMGDVLVWCTREMLVAIVVVNAPCIKPLFSSSTWLRHTSYHNNPSDPTDPSEPSSNVSNLKGGGAVHERTRSNSMPVMAQRVRKPSIMGRGYIPESNWSKSDHDLEQGSADAPRQGSVISGSKDGERVRLGSVTAPEPVLRASISKGRVVIRPGNKGTEEIEELMSTEDDSGRSSIRK